MDTNTAGMIRAVRMPMLSPDQPNKARIVLITRPNHAYLGPLMFYAKFCVLILSLLSLFGASVFLSPMSYAVADSTNQGRWTTPTENNLPDRQVPGFLVNLGPTGARAVLTQTTFIVRYVFASSPAVSRLMLEDVITGVFGRPFAAHRFKIGRAHV